MTEATQPVATPAPAAPAAAPVSNEPISFLEGVRELADRRQREADATEAELNKPDLPQRGERGRFVGQKQELAPPSEADAAPPEEAPGETIEADPADDLPSIEPPRSWTKEDKEDFKTLPRETQERIVEREKERERDFRRRQNETAELEKRSRAEAEAANRLRQQYEHVLRQQAAAHQSQMSSEFPDIRTQADVIRMAQENPARYVAWDAAQKLAAAQQAQVQQAYAHQAAQAQAQWQRWTADQDAKVLEAIPDLADREKSAQVLKEAEVFLKELGFSNDELRQHYSGQRVISMRDARLQQIVWEAAQYRKARAGLVKAQASPKPVPKVQRPGSPRSADEVDAARHRNLEKSFIEAKGNNQIRLASQLLRAKRGAQGR